MLPPSYDERPPYSPSLELYGLSLFKIERSTPWCDKPSNLQPVVVELNSNQLRVYKLKADPAVFQTLRALFRYQNMRDGKDVSDEWDSSGDSSDDECDEDFSLNDGPGIFTRLKSNILRAKVSSILKSKLLADFCMNNFLLEPTNSSQEYSTFAACYRGPLIHTFTLLNLSVGSASFRGLLKKQKLQESGMRNSSLLKERNVLRLRVEYMQVLLYMWSFHGMVHWYRSLVIGRDLAQLLDYRKLLVLKSLTSSPLVFDEDENEESRAETKFFFASSRNSSVSESSASSVFSAPRKYDSGDRSCDANCVNIMGHKIYCLENYYLYFEKRYIVRCIPVLNSSDKWQGSKVAVSNYEQLMLVVKGQELEGEMFMLGRKFNKVVKNLQRPATTPAHPCKEFYVYQLGLYNGKEKKDKGKRHAWVM